LVLAVEAGREDLSVLVGLALSALVGAYLVSVWILVARLQAARPDLYRRLGEPTGFFSPLAAGTWKLLFFILTGFPEPSARGVGRSVWTTRALLAVCLVALSLSSR
jgi:hypothetical protein